MHSFLYNKSFKEKIFLKVPTLKKKSFCIGLSSATIKNKAIKESTEAVKWLTCKIMMSKFHTLQKYF